MSFQVWVGLMTILFCSFARADLPEWAGRTRAEDSSALYFVGRGSGKSLAEAQSEARKDATETAIREIYGYKTKIKTVTYEGSQASEVVKGKSDSSRAIQLKDFNEINFYKESEADSINVYVQFKYSKQAIAEEFERLSKTQEKEESLDFISVESLKQKVEFETQSKAAPKDLNYSNYYSILKSWSIIVDGGIASEAYDGGKSNTTLTVGLQKRFSSLAIQIFGEQFFPRYNSDESRPDKADGKSYGFSTPYYWTNSELDNYYISPEFGFLNTELKSSTIKQQYYGLNIGWDLYFFDMNVGVRKYSDFETYKGQPSIYFSGGLKINF